MAKKEYKVWLDLYTGKHVVAPYENQTNRLVVPFFSRGDLYGNLFYIEVQQNGIKLNLTTESVDVHYYVGNQCEPVYTQGFGNGVSIANGEVVLELHPAVFAFIGDMTVKITITDSDERISSGEVKFNVMRGGEAGAPDGSWYKITAIYLTQAEYDALDAQGKIEQDQVYIITDAEGDLLINNANVISITDAGGYYTGTTVEDALQEIGADIGAQTYTEENYVADGESLTTSIDSLDMELKNTNDNVGDRVYTEENYVTDGETITESIDKLDQNLNLVDNKKAPATYLYGREIPFTWAEIKAKCEMGDFTGIHIGDWKPLTLTTSETVIMEVAGIDTYYGYASNGKHTIDFISRDCLSATYSMNPTNTNIGGWLASALYTAMNGTGGIYDSLPSDVKAVIGEKLMLLEDKAAADSTNWAWHTEPKLWLPAELEVFGYQSWSEIGYGSGNFKQYPLFAGSEKHIIKGAGNGGSASSWWELSPRRASATYFCIVSNIGYAYSTNAGYASRIPLCFRVS